MFLRSQFGGISPLFYLVLCCVCVLTLALSYWEGAKGLGLFVAVLGILYAFFAGAGKLICFVFGILYSILYAYIAFKIGLYGEVMLNFFYLPINVLGIMMWGKNQNKQHKVIVRSLSIQQMGIGLFIAFLLAMLYAAFLDSIGASLVYLNALSVVLQLMAFCLQVKRYVQNYAFVTLANLISIVMWWMVYADDPEAIAQLLNMGVFLGIGIYYWKEWAKEAAMQRLKNAEIKQGGLA